MFSIKLEENFAQVVIVRLLALHYGVYQSIEDIFVAEVGLDTSLNSALY